MELIDDQCAVRQLGHEAHWIGIDGREGRRVVEGDRQRRPAVGQQSGEGALANPQAIVIRCFAGSDS